MGFVHKEGAARQRSVPTHMTRYGSGGSALTGHTVVLLSSGADDVKGSQQTQLPQLDDRPAVGQMHLLRVRQGCRSSSGPGELLLLVVVPVISTTLAHYSRV